MVATLRPDQTVLTAPGLIVDPGLPYDPANGLPGFEVLGDAIAVSPAALHRIPRADGAARGVRPARRVEPLGHR